MFQTIDIRETLLLLPALIAAFTVHELSHGVAAYLLGDKTAKNDGRLTLNPIRHIDPVGLICILLFSFGWAKPVMVDARNLRNPQRDMALIALAGPVSNFILGFITFMIVVPIVIGGFNIPGLLINVMTRFGAINVLLGVFNLLPVPPLDGSKVIGGILPEDLYHRYMDLGRFGMPILLIAMVFGLTSTVIRPIIDGIISAFIMAAFSVFG